MRFLIVKKKPEFSFHVFVHLCRKDKYVRYRGVEKKKERERERKKQREREREKKTERKREREREKKTERKRDRETEIQRVVGGVDICILCSQI